MGSTRVLGHNKVSKQSKLETPARVSSQGKMQDGGKKAKTTTKTIFCQLWSLLRRMAGAVKNT